MGESHFPPTPGSTSRRNQVLTALLEPTLQVSKPPKHCQWLGCGPGGGGDGLQRGTSHPKRKHRLVGN